MRSGNKSDGLSANLRVLCITGVAEIQKLRSFCTAACTMASGGT